MESVLSAVGREQESLGNAVKFYTSLALYSFLDHPLFSWCLFLDFKLSKVNFSQSLFFRDLSMLSIAHIPFAHPLQPCFLLGWAMLAPAVPDEVQAEVLRATWRMAATHHLLSRSIPWSAVHTDVCSVGVYTSPLNVIMPLRQVQRLVLEEKIVGLGLSSFPVGVQSNLRQAVKKSVSNTVKCDLYL